MKKTRWRKHIYDRWSQPVFQDTTEIDVTACRHCYVHDDSGRVEERTVEWWPHFYEAVRLCGFEWEVRPYEEWMLDQKGWHIRPIGCDCFCHVLESPPAAIG